MEPRELRVARAEAIVEEVLRASPEGVPALVLVDRLVRSGFREDEGFALIDELRDARLLGTQRGRFVLLR